MWFLLTKNMPFQLIAWNGDLCRLSWASLQDGNNDDDDKEQNGRSSLLRVEFCNEIMLPEWIFCKPHPLVKMPMFKSSHLSLLISVTWLDAKATLGVVLVYSSQNLLLRPLWMNLCVEIANLEMYIKSSLNSREALFHQWCLSSECSHFSLTSYILSWCSLILLWSLKNIW